MRKEILLQGLNEEQRKAVLHQSGPMLVIAGPGSGKTHVIITRLIMMIHVYKIPPEKIMVITYTKDAAQSMSGRYSEKIQKEADVSFHTFHSFYYQIIKSIPRYSGYRLIQKKEKKQILSSLVNVQDFDEKDTLIEEILFAISFYKNTETLKLPMKHTYLTEEFFFKVFKQYEVAKEHKKVIDFDDMLYLCLQILRQNPAVLSKWRERFQYYLVDEFQDCNPVQYQVLKLLAVNHIFAVGDDDQVIYGFRGADSGIMSRFMKDYPQCKKTVLGINYRCGKKIVEASVKMIEENKLRISKMLTAYENNSFKSQVCIKAWQDRKEMLAYFTRLFLVVPKENLSHHSILFRTNQEIQIFADMFYKCNIPFWMREKSTSIYEHFAVKDMMTILEITDGRMERRLFLRILGKVLRNVGREAFERECVNLNELKEFYRSSYLYNSEAVLELESLEKHLQCLKAMSLPLKIRYIRKALKYDEYLYRKANGEEELLEEWQELLDWLQNDSERFGNLKEWEQYQKEYAEKLLSGNRTKTPGRDIQGIHMMTMHASKGLEFEHVYIINVNEGKIPKYQNGERLKPEQLEEERRIFYVGMTRAKKTLELHYLTGTKERPKYPSRFLKKLLGTM